MEAKKEVPEALRRLIKEIESIKDTSKAKSVYIEPLIEIDGLMVDETKTKGGRDFYDFFTSNWVAPRNASNFTIFVKELPYRMRTTMIMVQINDNTVYQNVMQPRYDYNIELAKQAIVRCQQYLVNYERIMKQLGGDDQSGSGIY